MFASEITGTARGCVHMSQDKPNHLFFPSPPPSLKANKSPNKCIRTAKTLLGVMLDSPNWGFATLVQPIT